jgi:hypothetical protein
MKTLDSMLATDEIYTMWEELPQLSDPAVRDEQLCKIGNYKLEQFECTPLFKVFIEVVADPKIVAERAFPA